MVNDDAARAALLIEASLRSNNDGDGCRAAEIAREQLEFQYCYLHRFN